jgi:uncharacterized protein (TIRG00374 family)
VARRWIWLVVAAFIGLAAFSLAGDMGHLGDQLEGFGWPAFGAALALALSNYLLRFVRWQLYLRRQDVRVPVTSSFYVFMAGLSLSITPAKLGELLKSYLLREMHDIPAPRVSDLIALLVLAVIGVAAYGVDPTFVIAAGGLLAVGLLLLAWQAPTRAMIDLVTRPKRARRLREPLHETLRGLGALCRPVPLLVSTAIAVPAWACECLGFKLICDAFPGASITLGNATLIYSVTTIAGALSFLPGGLGVTEGAMTVALVHSDIDKAGAVAATLLTRLATLWFAVLLGVVFLALARRRIARRVSGPVL